jgi:23S rRNA (pseudouridine1915-N3)-methyltransferase
MLKIKIIVIDRTKVPYIKGGECDYLKRIERFAPVEWVEIKPVRIRKGISDDMVRQKEGEAILRKLNSNDYIIVLDRTGKQYSSEDLAGRLNKLSMSVRGSVCFIIGGPVGLSGEIVKRADHVLSLSKLTLTHEMCRLLLIEQIYRSFTIIKGHKYHK